MDSALGVLLDGAAVKEKAEASKNLFRSAKHPLCGFEDILSAKAKNAPIVLIFLRHAL